MKRIAIRFHSTPCGELILGTCEDRLCLCDWRYRAKRRAIDARLRKALRAEFAESDNPLLDETQHQLRDYFSSSRKQFDIPLLPVGTDFQKRVWAQLLKIPYGTTLSYLDLAAQLGHNKAVRAVANANGANALSILVPCHRIIGSNGELVGYAGGLRAKEHLLNLEQNLFALQ